MAKASRHLYEIDLVAPISEYFQDLGYSIELEVPIYRNYADMIAYNNYELVAIELKLKNWKRALRQASYYQLGADRTYIAMPFYEAFEVYKRATLLNRERVGLLAVLLDNSEVRELLKPEISCKKLNYIEDLIRHRIGQKYEYEPDLDFSE